MHELYLRSCAAKDVQAVCASCRGIQVHREQQRLASLPNVLLMHVELENDKVPYKAFDRLRFEHHIDVTALSLSQTQGGNTYRVYAQVACD